MSDLKTQRKYPLWRACLAVLSVVANVVLPAAWSQAMSPAEVFGDAYSICLASGEKIAVTLDNHLPDDLATTTSHCNLCLFTGGFEAPTGSASPIAILDHQPVVLSYGYTEPAFAPQFHALKFDARAPPA